MNKEDNLEFVVTQIYDKKYYPHSHNTSEWSEFSPFAQKDSPTITYFKILEYSPQFQTSRQVCERARENLNGLLHEVDFYEISRNFESIKYLVRTNSNIMNLRSYCRLKRKNLQYELVLKILNFLKQIAKKEEMIVRISQDTIGINDRGEIKIIDYSYYFKPRQLRERVLPLKEQMREFLFDLIAFGKNQRNTWEIIQRIYEKQYGNEISEKIRALMKENKERSTIDKTSQRRTRSYAQNDTTLTESLMDQNLDQTIDHAKLFRTISLRISEISDIKLDLTHKAAQNKNRKKICLISILVFMLLVAGVTFLLYELHYNPRIKSCQVGQYLDQSHNKCLSCTSGCLKCENGLKDECSVCKEGMFLVISDFQKQKGDCSYECRGTLIRGNICIVPR